MARPALPLWLRPLGRRRPRTTQRGGGDLSASSRRRRGGGGGGKRRLHAAPARGRLPSSLAPHFPRVAGKNAVAAVRAIAAASPSQRAQFAGSATTAASVRDRRGCFLRAPLPAQSQGLVPRSGRKRDVLQAEVAREVAREVAQEGAQVAALEAALGAALAPRVSRVHVRPTASETVAVARSREGSPLCAPSHAPVRHSAAAMRSWRLAQTAVERSQPPRPSPSPVPARHPRNPV